MQFFRSVAALLSATAALAAQSPPPQPSFKVAVNLVQVDAVVTDSKGHHVANLEPADFEVTEDGKPQVITNFSWVAIDPSHPSTQTPQSSELRRSIVLMIDDSSRWGEADVFPVLTAARKFVTEQLAPGDLASVTASRGGMGFYTQLTGDKNQLLAAIDRVEHRPGFGQWTPITPSMRNTEGEIVDIPLRAAEPMYGYHNTPAPNPLAHLIWAIQSLAQMPGRKAIVLFSSGFAAPPGLIALANRAGVVIYVIDSHGLDVVFGFSKAPVPGRMLPPINGIERETVSADAPYRRLAQDTGGLFILSGPGRDLTGDLARVLEDMSGYYLIGYQSKRADAELHAARPVHHDIQLRMKRKDLTVRARNGFMGAPRSPAAAAPPAPQPHTTDEYLQQALYSPFNAGKIKLDIDAAFAPSDRDPKTNKRTPLLRAVLLADGNDLQFTTGPNGKKWLVYSILVALYNPDGTPAGSREQVYELNLTADEAADVMSKGLRTVMTVKLSRPGAFQIRAAVRDEATGATGSGFLFIDAPDFNRKQRASR